MLGFAKVVGLAKRGGHGSTWQYVAVIGGFFWVFLEVEIQTGPLLTVNP